MRSDTSSPPDSPASEKPSELSVEDRRHLLAWVRSARARGIDAAEDLRLRPWPVPITANVIGVFRAGDPMAAWLVVGQNEFWTVVSVEESRVLTTELNLPDALAAIHSPCGSGLD